MLLQDAPRGLGAQQASRYARLLAAVAEGARAKGVPAVAVSNLCSDVHPDYARVAAEASIACLRGTSEGIGAIARVLRWQAAPAPAVEAAPKDEAARARAADLLARTRSGSVLDEWEAKGILAAYDVPLLAARPAYDVEEVKAAFRELGGPVVIKGLAPGIAHKSEHGLVQLDIRSPQQAEHAARELLRRGSMLGKEGRLRLLVQPMIAPVAELLVGARVDADFGPIIVAGTGGIGVELFGDVAVRLAPVSAAAAADMLRATKAGKLLGGWRGRPKGDFAAVVDIVCRLSRLIVDLEGEIREIEINPLAALPEGSGCLPLDCLVIRA